MKRAKALPFLFLMSLVACRQPPVAPVKGPPSTISEIRKLEDARGGPRIFDRYETGKVEETLDPQFKDLTPGFVEIYGTAVTENESRKAGVFLVFTDVSIPKDSQAPKKAAAYLDESEVETLHDAVRSERDYVAKAAKNPPQNSEEMRWGSVEGFTVATGFSKGNPTYYAQAPMTRADDSDTVGLTLDSTAVDQLLAKIDAALNLAKNNK